MLRAARGLPHPPPPVRPRQHRFASFEHRLPLSYQPGSTVALRPGSLAGAPERGRVPKPTLQCAFCRGVKAFASVVGYWGHLVYAHPGEEEEDCLAEVRKAALAWKEYQKRTYGRKDRTTRKIQQTLAEGFS